MAKFLNKYTINLAKVPQYVEFNGDWQIPVDKCLANMILQSEDPRLTPEMKAEWKKTVDCITEDNKLSIVMRPRFNGLGRRYPEQPTEPTYTGSNGQVYPNRNFGKCYGDLTIHAGIIKNTIFHYMGYVDRDQVKGHPTIVYEVEKKAGNRVSILESYLRPGGFENWCQELIPWYSVESEPPLLPADIKNLVNVTIYGGSHSGWCNEITWTKLKDTDVDKLRRKGKFPREMKNQDRPHPLYQRLLEDLNSFQRRVFDNNPELVQIVKEHSKCADDSDKPFSKLRNKVVSCFCQILENEFTSLAMKYCVENTLCNKRAVDWGYDGFTAPPCAFSYADLEFHDDGLNAYVREKSGFQMVTFIRKPFPENKILFDVIQQRRDLVMAVMVNPLVQPVPAVAVNVAVVAEDDNVSDLTTVVLTQSIQDDSEGADIIFDAIGDRLKFSKGNYFFKQENIWVNSKQEVETNLRHFILFKCDLFKLDAKGNKKPYSKNVSGANALLTAVMTKVIVDGQDDELYEKFIVTTKGRLCFLDGVLEFREKTGDKQGRFYTWAEINGTPAIGEEPAVEPAFEYYSPSQIKRNFQEYFNEPDQEIMGQVKQKVFTELFGDKVEDALKFFSRGVAGHFEDKSWAMYLGNRNCGKGVVNELSNCSLGSYSGSLKSANLLCNSNRSLKQEQPEKQMAFAMDFQFCRLVWSQELPPPPKGKSIKLNGDIIKELNSGGDTLKGKRNYDIYITEFKNQARLIVMGNDCCEATNNDCFETCIEFSGVNTFKSQAEIDLEIQRGTDPLILETFKLADPEIKTVSCKSEAWCNAFIMLMLENYTTERVVANAEIDEEEEADIKEMAVKSVRKFILENFVLVDANVFVSCEDIQNRFVEEEFGDISPKKIAIELKALKRKPGRKAGKRGWFGLELIPKVEPVLG